MAQGEIQQETLKVLADIEKAIASLADNPHDAGAIEQVYRGWNTLGVMGEMFRYHTMESLGREAARAFDLLRCTERPANPEILRLARTAHERIQLLF